MQIKTMLREIQNARQIPGESSRRWFHSANMDLIVWLRKEADSEIAGFQLCYDKIRGEKALHWKDGSGFSHMNVDDGENAGGKYKATPLLVPDAPFDGCALHRLFLSAARGGLMTFAVLSKKNCNRPPDSPSIFTTRVRKPCPIKTRRSMPTS